MLIHFWETLSEKSDIKEIKFLQVTFEIQMDWV